MAETAIDRLYQAVADRGHVCAGLDTSPDYLPRPVLERFATKTEAVLAYNKALIDATIDAAACYKVQIAYYEALGLSGLRAYAETLRYLREKKTIVIADIKRGDIADTAKQYAKAHFEGDFAADFVTLSPYMGMDSIEPWLASAKRCGCGAFVLMRTSNPGMRDFECLKVDPQSRPHPASPRGGGEEVEEEGEISPLPLGGGGGGHLSNAVGDKLAALAEREQGACGYGLFGAVVGCTEREEAAEIRRRYPGLFFLIPGYGAQGGAAEDAVVLLQGSASGGVANGGVVNASRSLLQAWRAEQIDPEGCSLNDAALAARRAALKMRDEIRVLL